MDNRITYACVTRPNLDAVKRNIPLIMPHVDQAVLVLGEENKEVESFLDQYPNVHQVRFDWCDDFAASWNAYINFLHAREYRGWVLILDDDEVPSEQMLAELRPIAEGRHGQISAVEFRCNPVYDGNDTGPCNYWRRVFYRLRPGAQYRCHLHQFLVGSAPGRIIRSDATYYHFKTTLGEYTGACRNWWQGGIWRSGARMDGEKGLEWHELRDTVQCCHPDVTLFNHLYRHLKDNTVHEDVKRLIVSQYKQFETSPLHNELRAYFTLFFTLLHPEEDPAQYE